VLQQQLGVVVAMGLVLLLAMAVQLLVAAQQRMAQQQAAQVGSSVSVGGVPRAPLCSTQQVMKPRTDLHMCSIRMALLAMLHGTAAPLHANASDALWRVSCTALCTAQWVCGACTWMLLKGSA
jgi:hypothetical protein